MEFFRIPITIEADSREEAISILANIIQDQSCVVDVRLNDIERL